MLRIIARHIQQEKNGLESGYRVLVDRHWPEGESRESMAVDDWWQAFAPEEMLIAELKAGQVDDREFRERYLKALRRQEGDAAALLETVAAVPLVLVSAVGEVSSPALDTLRDYLLALSLEKECRVGFSSPPCYLAELEK